MGGHQGAPELFIVLLVVLHNQEGVYFKQREHDVCYLCSALSHPVMFVLHIFICIRFILFDLSNC